MLIVLVEESTSTLSTALVQIDIPYSQFDHGNAWSHTPLQERDHPDQDFYQNSTWTHSLIHLMIAYATCTTTLVLVFSGLVDTKLIRFLIPTPYVITYLPVYLPLAFWIFIISSMLLEDISYAQGSVLISLMGITRKTFLQWYKIFLFGVSLASGFLVSIPATSVAFLTALSFLCACVAMYGALSVIVYTITIRYGNVFL
jgi:hypothetical protein